MRLIDADALKKTIDREIFRHDTIDHVFQIIDDAPTIEPKRGRWKIEGAETIYGKAYLLTCSECGETVSVTETALPYEHFCRNCGADMRPKGGDDV